jgi:hypothetical protein
VESTLLNTKHAQTRSEGVVIGWLIVVSRYAVQIVEEAAIERESA